MGAGRRRRRRRGKSLRMTEDDDGILGALPPRRSFSRRGTSFWIRVVMMLDCQPLSPEPLALRDARRAGRSGRILAEASYAVSVPHKAADGVSCKPPLSVFPSPPAELAGPRRARKARTV